MNSPFRPIKTARPQLRLFGPGEPGNHEQLTWLVLFIKDLKAQVKQLMAEKEAMAFQLKGNEPITDAEQEVLDLRYQVNMLWHRNALLEKKMAYLSARNRELNQALDEKDWDDLIAA